MKSINTVSIFLCISIIFALSIAYPLVGFITLILVGVFSPKIFSNYLLRTVHYWALAIFSLYITLSRSFEIELQADLAIYHAEYTQILFSHSITNIQSYFSNSFEFGWPIVYYIISKFTGQLAPLDIFFINSLLVYLGLFIWLELHGKKLVSPIHYGVLYSCVFLFLSTISIGFLQRQSLSLVFILFFISNIDNFKAYLYAFIACIFHLSAIYYIIFIILAYNLQTGTFIVLTTTLLVLVRITIEFLFTYLEKYSGIGINKIFYFLNQDLNITSLRYIVIVIPIVIFCFFVSTNFKNSFWFKIILFAIISYLTLLGIPNLPERMSFIFITLSGLMLVLIAFENSTYKLPFYLYICFYISIFILERINLTDNSISYWIRYSPLMLNNIM